MFEFDYQTRQKIAISKMAQRITQLPVELDVPFAAAIVGFRPSRLPPLPEGFCGVSIGQIQHLNWADRVGLNVGDVITHVNGVSVRDMTTPSEFTEPIQARPLRLTVKISVTSEQLNRLLGEFDWSARMHEVGKVRSVHMGEETNDMFERVFSEESEPQARSNLFDHSKWVSIQPTAQPVEQSTDKEDVVPLQITIKSTQDELVEAKLAEVLPLVVKKSPKPPKPHKMKPDSTLWLPNSPVSVSVVVHSGKNIPEYAGTFNMDYMAQPFRSDPFVDVYLSLVGSSDTLSLDEIAATSPIEPSAQSKSDICNNSQVWGHSATLTVNNPRLRVADLVLIGKLWDYRRLSAAKLIGVFAVPLLGMQVSATRTNPHQISLTSADQACFDLSQTKLSISMHVVGTSKLVLGSPAASSAGSPVVSSSVTSVSGFSTPHVEPVTRDNEETLNVANTHIPTPFERALAKARAEIRNGDFSPLHMQSYSLRF